MIVIVSILMGLSRDTLRLLSKYLNLKPDFCQLEFRVCFVLHCSFSWFVVIPTYLPWGVQESYNLDWDYVRWQSPERIYSTLGSYNDRCVGVAGLFPGLRWRGAFLAVSAFLTPAKHIFSVANVLQSFAIGNDTPYLAGNEHTTLRASHGQFSVFQLKGV